MFSTDPDVYGEGVNLVASAAKLEALVTMRVEALATAIQPPFTPPRRRKIRAALAEAQTEATRLGRLCNRWIVEMGADRQHQGRVLRLGQLLQLWNDAAERLEATIMAAPRPLTPDTPRPGSLNEAVAVSTDRFFERLHMALSPDTPVYHVDEGPFHGDIPLPMTRFQNLIRATARLLRAMDRPEPWSFLEVGCGIGLKLLAAQEQFAHVVGIEYDAPRAAAAGAMMDRAHLHLTEADDAPSPWLRGTAPQARAAVQSGNALEFADYGSFDVIYAYRPIADTGLRTQLERRIIADARPGTLLIMPYPDFGATGGAEGSVQLDRFIHLKPLPDQKPEALVRRAGHVGLIRPTEPTGGRLDEGFVAPLTAALRHWGHLS